MKQINILLVILWIFTACKETKTQSPQPESPEEGPVFTTAGAPVSDGEVLAEGAMADLYGQIKPGDTVLTRFEGEVVSVCQMKGCWMRLALPDEKTVMVRFKDYGFFVPKDISGGKVVVEGKAYVSEVDEAERRHMAQDAGQPDSLIAAIRGPEMQMGFEASGVRIFR
ncbi:DUF4920 domain-containing protein [Robiginitalea marina]|uniref:DUF4920 domain-containing protein n=1 Tax=Robiginitalea marina TaxID=2954105 RepID=A0ABT1AVK0_9FLAO|nr:DUF4920 domain-containing protein [Robiginitalea marina]MCO5724081.1 DUF4920 domain-containing protein [Robiginitalea marina]